MTLLISHLGRGSYALIPTSKFTINRVISDTEEFGNSSWGKFKNVFQTSFSQRRRVSKLRRERKEGRNKDGAKLVQSQLGRRMHF